MDSHDFDQKLDRRTFFRQVGITGLAGVGLMLGLTACGGDKESGAATKAAASKSASPAASADPCSDLTGLTQDEKNMRTTLQYQATAADPAKPCHTCNFWHPPAEGTTCGTCTLMKGPIDPNGGCISWVVKQTT
jgi:hypothetical protein|nr:hypothetical protein [Candidatus Krumholzibacteria bacterium]